LRDFADAGAVRGGCAGLVRCGRTFSEPPETALGLADLLGHQGADGRAGGRGTVDGRGRHGGGVVGRQRRELRRHQYSDTLRLCDEAAGSRSGVDSRGRPADRAPDTPVPCDPAPMDIAWAERCAVASSGAAGREYRPLGAMAAIGSPPRAPRAGGSADGGSGTTTGPSDACGMNGVAPPGRALSLMVDDPALIAASTGREVMTTSTDTMNA
jgi:hypothetical protein